MYKNTHNEPEGNPPKQENESAENSAPGDNIENEGQHASMNMTTITTTSVVPLSNKGELLVDATACSQDIKFPTDLNVLNDAREKLEELINVLYAWVKEWDEKDKLRTYRQLA